MSLLTAKSSPEVHLIRSLLSCKLEQCVCSLEQSQAENSSCALFSIYTRLLCPVCALCDQWGNEGLERLNPAWVHIAISYRDRIQGEESLTSKCFHDTQVDSFTETDLHNSRESVLFHPSFIIPLEVIINRRALGPGLWLQINLCLYC